LSINKNKIAGKLVIISAPSGAGKTTVVKHLLNSGLNLEFSVSATTRPSRSLEENGKDYYFISVEEFRKKVDNNEFIEWEEVYKDCYYGTLKSEVERIWAKGNHIIFDVDVAGGLNLKNIFGVRSLALFIMPPSAKELERRLVNRGTDDPVKTKMRTDKAEAEMKFADKFDDVIINHKLDKALKEVYEVVASFLRK
jgi:guanylate kinase